MSYRIRLIFTFIRSFFGPRLDITKEYRRKFIVWPTESELSVVENSRYAYFFVLERFRVLFSTSLLGVCLKKQWTSVMGAQIYKVKRPLRRFQRFEVITKPLCWDEKWIYFEQRIESGGKLISSAVISVIFLSKEQKIPTAEVLKAGGFSQSSPKFSESVLKFIAAEKELL